MIGFINKIGISTIYQKGWLSMKIFVSSTVKDLGYLRDELYRRLKELGHTPWLSEMSDFPINLHPDSMTNCIMVAEKCDLFVVLLDKRAGLSYTPCSSVYQLNLQFNHFI